MESKIWIEKITPVDGEKQQLVKEFLALNDLEMDQVDLSLIAWSDQKIVGTCSKNGNLIKCLAVHPDFQNQGLTNLLIGQMLKIGFEKGIEEWLVLTKFSKQDFFVNLNFTPIYWDAEICFLTNNPAHLNQYQNYLKQNSQLGDNGVIVMNANPLTNGHLFLIAQAAKKCAYLYLVVVKEDVSFFTYEERKAMLRAVSQRFKNVLVLEGSQYLLSQATFPSYFLKSPTKVVEKQAFLDAKIFVKLFQGALNLKTRFVGTEPFSPTTAIYNQILKEVLTEQGLNLEILERKMVANEPISASKVRQILGLDPYDLTKITDLVPPETLEILKQIDLPTRVKTKNKLLKKDY